LGQGTPRSAAEGLAAAFTVAANITGKNMVLVKMLPFDNKNELQVVIDMPESATLESTDAVAVSRAATGSGTTSVHSPKWIAPNWKVLQSKPASSCWVTTTVWAVALAAAGAGADETPAAPAGPKPVENLLAKRLQRLYYHLYQGNLEDREANRKLAVRYQQEADARQAEAAEAAAKKRAYEERVELARLYQKLSEQNAAIVKALEEAAADLAGLAAMEAIPRLEQQIERIGGNKVEREWLTVDEVRARADRGMEYKTEASDILPYAVHHWFVPGKDKESTGRAPKRLAPRQEAAE
jgi:multidrug efflux pump subunit AcrB